MNAFVRDPSSWPVRAAGIVLGLLGATAAMAGDLWSTSDALAVQHLNPPPADATTLAAGRILYATHCASCHGLRGEGTGNIPALIRGRTQQASAQALFSAISRGAPENGMPAWSQLTPAQRWQLVRFIQDWPGRGNRPVERGVATEAVSTDAGPAHGPFVDFRQQIPGRSHRISIADLPAPYATASARNGARLVPRPDGVLPQAPAGFAVNLYAEGLSMPRVIRRAPNGDVFVAESGAGQVRVYRGLDAQGRPQQSQVFARGLQRPYGIAFHPPGTDPRWVYVGSENQLVRYPYRNGDLQARGQAQVIADLPSGGHWTRDVQFSLDGRTLFVAVGSHSNVDDPDTTPAERQRANILAFDPEGGQRRVYASGLRNPSGIAVDPRSGQLWCVVNERDGLGDDLVPDYLTSVREGGFYGWPWWYLGAHQDPRHAGKHPELAARTLVPDVLLQPHNAPLQLVFYDGVGFPAQYHGDLFLSAHGSWNKSTRVGYQVLRVPRDGTAKANGRYEDFLTGFVLPDGQVWGRPVGVAVAADGALLVSDDGSGSIWRVAWKGR